MNTSTTKKPRQESDRQGEKKWYSALMARPEVGPLGVMILLFCMLGYFSISEGQFSLNPFSGEGFTELHSFFCFHASSDELFPGGSLGAPVLVLYISS